MNTIGKASSIDEFMESSAHYRTPDGRVFYARKWQNGEFGWWGYARIGARDVHEFGPFSTPGRARGVAKAFLVRRGVLKRGE